MTKEQNNGRVLSLKSFGRRQVDLDEPLAILLVANRKNITNALPCLFLVFLISYST